MVRDKETLVGDRVMVPRGHPWYPEPFNHISRPPRRLYIVGNPHALKAGLAVVGARKATPYGMGCARRFATQAAKRGITIISGGARGCDSVAHLAALEVSMPTVVFLGGGCDELYPREHTALFQRVVDGGGAVVSEHPWDFKPVPFAFRERNRLIAGLAKATLIVEAGLPSGTFSTADEALAAGKEVLVVPGAITSQASHGANQLIYQGATPIIDDDTFEAALSDLFGCEQVTERSGASTRNTDDQQVPEVPCQADWHVLPTTTSETDGVGLDEDEAENDPHTLMLRALGAEPLDIEDLTKLAKQYGDREDPITWLMVWLAQAERDGVIARYNDGRYGPILS